MRAFKASSILAAALITAVFSPSLQAGELELNVVDELGRPLPAFEATVPPNRSPMGRIWGIGANGHMRLSDANLPPAFNVIVRADGYASLIKRFAGQGRDALIRNGATLTVLSGDNVQLQLHLPDEQRWPQNALAEVHFQSCADDVGVINNRDDQDRYNQLNAQPLSTDGKFEFRIAPASSAFCVGVRVPGFLRSYFAGPFTAADVKQGVLTVELPKPAHLEVNFDLGSSESASRPFKFASLSISNQDVKNGRLFLRYDHLNPDSGPFVFSDLPAGNYVIRFSTADDTELSVIPSYAASIARVNPILARANPHIFADEKEISLRSGKLEKVVFKHTALNPDAFRGNRTATVRFETADGRPAAGRELSMNYYVDHYGFLPVFSGKVPANGEVVLEHISDKNLAPAGVGGPYIAVADNERIGVFGFRTTDSIEQFVLHFPPRSGDIAPDVELLNVSDGKTIKLSDLRGKLVVLEFWATWCGPCQPTLQTLDKMVADKTPAWTDRVVILPVSIDEQSELAKKHLLDRGWTHLNAYWNGSGATTPAMRAFVVNSVPTSFMIDPQGKILWRGNLTDTKEGKTLEARIEEALKSAE